MNESEHFSERTDTLAQKMGVSLRDLAKLIGMSQAMFFGYRSGKYPISRKALEKIERFESEQFSPVSEPKSNYNSNPKLEDVEDSGFDDLWLCSQVAGRLCGNDKILGQRIFEELVHSWNRGAKYMRDKIHAKKAEDDQFQK